MLACGSALPAGGDEAHAAMAADVEEGAKAAVGVARQQQRHAVVVVGEHLAGGELAGVADDQRQRPEQARDLGVADRVAEVVLDRDVRGRLGGVLPLEAAGVHLRTDAIELGGGAGRKWHREVRREDGAFSAASAGAASRRAQCREQAEKRHGRTTFRRQGGARHRRQQRHRPGGRHSARQRRREGRPRRSQRGHGGRRGEVAGGIGARALPPTPGASTASTASSPRRASSAAAVSTFSSATPASAPSGRSRRPPSRSGTR